jgi:thymidylate synthase
MNMNIAWLNTLSELFMHGTLVSPRNHDTLEVPQHTTIVDMRHPVLTIRERKLSYRFLAAEAYWILSGDDTVAGISPWNKHIANFSDDGTTFFGAYGPKVIGQLDYVVRKLHEDPDTRQAGLTIWRENPPQTKDVPCTVSIFASMRDGKLNMHVFMRSSDVWLGLPYDVFNFSMLAHLICARLLQKHERAVQPGTLFLTAASCHLYDKNWKEAKTLLSETDGRLMPRIALTPSHLYTDEEALMRRLKLLRESSPGDAYRWWEATGVGATDAA